MKFAQETLAHIGRQVSEAFNVPIEEIHGQRRKVPIVRARQAAIALSRKFTHASLAQIGKTFGGRDHTTVMHSIAAVERLLVEDAAFADRFALVQQSLEPTP